VKESKQKTEEKYHNGIKKIQGLKKVWGNSAEGKMEGEGIGGFGAAVPGATSRNFGRPWEKQKVEPGFMGIYGTRNAARDSQLPDYIVSESIASAPIFF